MVLAIICNFIFLYWLCVDAFILSENYLDNDNEPTGLSIAEYIMTCVAIIAVIFMVFLISITIKPLHEGLYEHIFWQVGANHNRIAAHKAKTLYKAVLKVDLVTILLFLNTFTFLCWDGQTKGLHEDWWKYWVLDVSLVTMLLANNYHGHYMLEKEKLIYMMPYYIGRFLLEAAMIYIAICTQ